jgi:hypothetical protein
MTRALTAFLAFAFLLISDVHAQTTARLPDGHWSITVPQGWKVVDDATLEGVNQRVSGVSVPGGKVQYVMMLVSTDRDGCYALLQWGGSLPAGASFDAFAKGLMSGMDQGLSAVREAMPDQIASAAFDSPLIDRERQRIYIPGMTAGPDGGTIRFISSPRPGSGETITVHGYSPSDRFDQNKPTLIAIADSFAFDQGYTYPFAKPKPQGFDFAQVGIAGVLGGIAGVVIWGVRKLKGR